MSRWLCKFIQVIQEGSDQSYSQLSQTKVSQNCFMFPGSGWKGSVHYMKLLPGGAPHSYAMRIV